MSKLWHDAWEVHTRTVFPPRFICINNRHFSTGKPWKIRRLVFFMFCKHNTIDYNKERWNDKVQQLPEHSRPFWVCGIVQCACAYERPRGGNISVHHLASHYLCHNNPAGARIEQPTGWVLYCVLSAHCTVAVQCTSSLYSMFYVLSVILKKHPNSLQ